MAASLDYLTPTSSARSRSPWWIFCKEFFGDTHPLVGGSRTAYAAPFYRTQVEALLSTETRRDLRLFLWKTSLVCSCLSSPPTRTRFKISSATLSLCRFSTGPAEHLGVPGPADPAKLSVPSPHELPWHRKLERLALSWVCGECIRSASQTNCGSATITAPFPYLCKANLAEFLGG